MTEVSVHIAIWKVSRAVWYCAATVMLASWLALVVVPTLVAVHALGVFCQAHITLPCQALIAISICCTFVRNGLTGVGARVADVPNMAVSVILTTTSVSTQVTDRLGVLTIE